jgi:formylglycine-generating enzyme
MTNLLTRFALAPALLVLAMIPARAVTPTWVTVGDPGNVADTTGYGAVADSFRIMKYDVTIRNYSDFLNAVARTDTYSLYNPNMVTSNHISGARGIQRTGTSGAYTYQVFGSGSVPITYVSWFDAARFANWIQNGQLSGTAGAASTEYGAYTLAGGTSGDAVAVNAGAQYYVPTENQWYKAAYYKGGGTNAGYWAYGTQSDSTPGTTIGSTPNQANYRQGPTISGAPLTAVGAFSASASAYGLYDMSGNVRQWNDLDGTASSSRGYRGGYWRSTSEVDLSSSTRTTNLPSTETDGIGFRLAALIPVPEPSTCASLVVGLAVGGVAMWRRRQRACGVWCVMRIARLSRVAFSVGMAALVGSLAVPAHAITYELVTVGNAGNANDPATGGMYGGVAYDYQIGKYAVTIGQYTDFLNAVAKTDTYSLYSASMGTNQITRGISRSGVSGSYSYSVMAVSGSAPYGGVSAANRPISYVSWWDSARFANWVANGQPTGAQTSTTTENGAYNVNGAMSGDAPARNVTNPNTGATPTYVIPTENEWYKAAYYSPVLNSGSGGYYTYATQSNAAPGNVPGSGSNQANYTTDVFSVTQSGDFAPDQNFLTDVGAFTNSASYFGTFDQSGNVYQWNDLTGAAGFRGLRGGFWATNAFYLSSSPRDETAPSTELDATGFRLASPVAVPEPSTWVSLVVGLAFGGVSLWRRRRLR